MQFRMQRRKKEGIHLKKTTKFFRVRISDSDTFQHRKIDFLVGSFRESRLRQVSGIKYLNQMRTYHLASGDTEITKVG